MTKLREILVSVLTIIALGASVGMGFVILGAGIAFGALMALIVWIMPKNADTLSEVQSESGEVHPTPA